MNGHVDEQGRALLSIALRIAEDATPSQVQVWVDTAFTGDLVMPKSQIEQLGLRPGLMVHAVLADGRNSRLKTFVGWVEWFGEILEVEIVAGEGSSTLLGIGLLLGHRLNVDYSRMELSLK